jgi:AraC-like DNA-binding protein
MISDSTSTLSGELFAELPALKTYLSALEHIVPGSVRCEKVQPKKEGDILSVKVPLPDGSTVWVVVDIEAAGDSSSPPPFWRRPSVERMLDAIEENLRGKTPLHQWPGAVKTAWSLVTQHPRRSMSLGEVAVCLKLSAGYLGERFEKVTGSAFRCVLRDERVAIACQYLLTTDLRISEIADKLGGQSLSQFNRNFAAATGYNPRAYRSKYQKGEWSKLQVS